MVADLDMAQDIEAGDWLDVMIRRFNIRRQQGMQSGAYIQIRYWLSVRKAATEIDVLMLLIMKVKTVVFLHEGMLLTLASGDGKGDPEEESRLGRGHRSAPKHQKELA